MKYLQDLLLDKILLLLLRPFRGEGCRIERLLNLEKKEKNNFDQDLQREK